MERPSLDTYWTSMLPLVAARATCPRRSVGAILVDPDGRIISSGYNGPPSLLPHCTEFPCPGARDETGNNQRCEAIHAETNALLGISGSRRVPHTLYCSATPCFACSKLILATHLSCVVATSLYQGDMAGLQLLKRAGVGVFIFRKNERFDWEFFHNA